MHQGGILVRTVYFLGLAAETLLIFKQGRCPVLSKWLALMFVFSAGCLIGDLPTGDVIASDSRVWSTVASAPKASVEPINPAKSSKDPLLETVEELEARSGELSEPSQESEELYVKAVRSWLATLAPYKRERARRIMRDAHPGLQALREAIRDKKSQLASISFDKGMPPETLPRLGMELQRLRADLNAQLRQVGDRLRSEADVEIGPADDDSFWLAPPDPED